MLYINPMDSNLQIISGKWRGRKMSWPDGARPTQNRARIALFNILHSILAAGDYDIKTVWDAFAGSGAIGIEFLSREWANRAILTDSNPNAAKIIRNNARDISGAEIVIADAIKSIPRFAPDTDLVFIDPPFANSDFGAKFVSEFTTHAAIGAILVWERPATRDAAPLPDNLKILKQKKYGRAEFLILIKTD